MITRILAIFLSAVVTEAATEQVQHFLRQQDIDAHHRDLAYKPYYPPVKVIAGETNSLNLCEGDCDDDSDCLGDLVCYPREGGKAVPGCTGGKAIGADAGFCINPPVTIGSTKPYGLCEANCTDDADCDGELICFGRDGGDPTPGCSGGDEIDTRIGVCINPRPVVTGDFPLGKCEGECDNNSDCSGDLICYQREGKQFIPGCAGGESRAARADYCTDAIYGPETAESFKLKLYWETGYKWQGETTERKFCLSCRRTTCVAGIETIIVECSEARVNFITFVEQGSNDEVVMQLTDYPTLCLKRGNGPELRTAVCNFDDPKQRFIAQPGTFDDSQFEITPKGASSLCVSLARDPKRGRVILIQSCAAARRSNTSFWNKYEIQS